MKSARGPTKIRDEVLAMDSSRTWVEVAMSVDGSRGTRSFPEGGRARTMVPMLDMTISH